MDMKYALSSRLTNIHSNIISIRIVLFINNAFNHIDKI